VNGTITSATNIQNITYTAGASGTVDLTLVVTNASGCSATNTVNVTINANPTTPTITPTPAQVCASSTGNSAAGPAGRDDVRLVDRERHDHLGHQHPEHHLHRRRLGHGRT
jgi:PKD repeat protein